MKVTMPDIMHGLERMLEIYPRPRHAPAETVDFAKMWFRELGDLDVEAFRAGVSTYCKTAARYFPAPGEIRHLGSSVARTAQGPGGLLGDYQHWERSWGAAPLNAPLPCPICGAVDTWSNGHAAGVRRGVIHDPAKHDAAGVPFIDSAHQLALKPITVGTNG